MYSIKQASELCGVSCDMIRHYEKLGILHPSRNPNNQYRQYTEAELNLITLVKLYSTLGVDLKTCAKIVMHKDITAGYEQLKSGIRDLENQRVWLERRLDASRRMSAALEGYLSGEPWRVLDAQDVILYPRKQTGAEGNGYARLIASTPAFHYFYRVRARELLSVAAGEYAHDVGIFTQGALPFADVPSEVLTRRRILQTWLTLPDHTPLCVSHMRETLAAIIQLGYQVAGDLILYQIVGSNKRDDPAVVLCVEIPISAVR